MKKTKLKIAVLQTEIFWENPQDNRIHFEQKINEVNDDFDLIVLPEMFTTGFTMNPRSHAESMKGTTINWLIDLAQKSSIAIAGSLIIEEENQFYNRFVFIHPDGKIDYYNKRHLFTLAGEHKCYQKGEVKKIIEYKGWKICPQVCYDLRFPVWSRNVEKYDLLIYVANWPKPRINAWKTLLMARAIENLCYVVGVNRIGIDANDLSYNGHSAIIDPLGSVIGQLNPNEDSHIVSEIDQSNIQKIRKQLAFLEDQDQFKIT